MRICASPRGASERTISPRQTGGTSPVSRRNLAERRTVVRNHRETVVVLVVFFGGQKGPRPRGGRFCEKKLVFVAFFQGRLNEKPIFLFFLCCFFCFLWWFGLETFLKKQYMQNWSVHFEYILRYYNQNGVHFVLRWFYADGRCSKIFCYCIILAGP